MQQNVAARRLLLTEDPRRTRSFCITGDAKAKPRSLLSSPLLVLKKGTTLPGQAALAESSFVPGGFTARRGISGALESPSVGRELSCLKGPRVAPKWGSLRILYWKAVTSPDPRSSGRRACCELALRLKEPGAAHDATGVTRGQTQTWRTQPL